ncbi:putative ATP-dependent RNA helicase [Trichinella spiralis]|uniref:ATP-dependent RNA helicase n=1 Tax=Trichinella spiralis TaxID=6334 RepID=A0ABR3K2N1_TRISP
MVTHKAYHWHPLEKQRINRGVFLGPEKGKGRSPSPKDGQLVLTLCCILYKAEKRLLLCQLLQKAQSKRSCGAANERSV